MRENGGERTGTNARESRPGTPLGLALTLDAMDQSSAHPVPCDFPPPLPNSRADAAPPCELRLRFDASSLVPEPLVVVSRGAYRRGEHWPDGTLLVELDRYGGHVTEVGSRATASFARGAPGQLGGCWFALEEDGPNGDGADLTVFDRTEWLAPELRVRAHDESLVRFHCRLSGASRESLVVGRGQEGVDLPLEDQFVSRRHARFFARGEEHCVEDLGSKGGTFVNGERIDAARVLRHRDQVRIGNTVLEFHSFAQMARVMRVSQAPAGIPADATEPENAAGTAPPLSSGPVPALSAQPSDTAPRASRTATWLELCVALLALALLGLSGWRIYRS